MKITLTLLTAIIHKNDVQYLFYEIHFLSDCITLFCYSVANIQVMEINHMIIIFKMYMHPFLSYFYLLGSLDLYLY